MQEDTGGGTTYYGYNAAGDLRQVTDAANNVTSINYNTLGQKVNMTDPDMGTWYYSYDLNGNLYQQTDAKGQTITFTYDALNRVIFKDYSTSDPDVTYAYDNTASGANGIGRLYSVTNGNDTTTYNSYDSMGRVLSVTKSISGDQARTTYYTYDYSGKLLTTQYPGTDNFIVTNTYYAGSNLLSAVSGSDGVTYASISDYSPSGKMISVAHGNNTTDTYTYDARSEKLSQVLTASNVSGTLQQKIYYYTAIGEISAILNMPSPGWLGYTYDKLGRLTNEYTNGTSSMTITYNAIGNITSKTVGGNTFTYSYSADHKHAVCSVTYNGSIYPYFYDSNGNMTYGPDFTNLGNIQARTITYNADNMPVQLSYSSGVTTQFTYGGTGERVKKRVNSGGNVTDTYYIGDHFEVRGGETVKYIFAGNLRVVQIKGSTRSFFHKDHLGSSTVMTDASGYVIESTEYMPFGSVRSHSGANTSDYKYTDQELDAENGLYNYNARLYDPFIGRFISPDTIVPEPFNPQSLNRYSYCLNNPLIYVDPSGHAEEDDWAACIAMWQYVNSLYEVWPQLGGSLAHEMGFMDPVSPLVDLWNLGFEELNAWINVKSFYYGGGGSSGYGQAQAANAASANPKTVTDAEKAHKQWMINSTIAYYGINVTGIKITYDPNLTTSDGRIVGNNVTIGPGAFAHTIGVLGLVISHETEGHYLLNKPYTNRSIIENEMIHADNEVRAYQYSLSQVTRFGVPDYIVNGPRGINSQIERWINRRDYFQSLLKKE